MTLQKFKREHQSHLIIKQSFSELISMRNLNVVLDYGNLMTLNAILQLVKAISLSMYPAKTR